MSKENQYARYLETLDKALKNVVETIGEGKVEFAGLPVEEWAGPGYAVAALFDPFVVSAKLRDSRIFLDFPAGADIPPGIVFHEKRNSQKERISFVAGGNRTAELQLPTLWGGVPWNRFETSAGWQELGRIAEYPAAAVRDGVAVFAFNPLRVIHRYLCMAKPETTAWLTDLMVEAILAASGLEATLDGNDLRRDFHSFGISVLMLEQMHRAAGKVWNAGEIQPGLRQAAEAYVAGDFPAAETGLKGLFQSLETRRRQLVPVPVYLIDMPHGGVLFDDEGYAEFDSPELAARVLNLYLDWNDKYHFHFAPDIGAATLEKFARLSPRTIERMRNAWSRGEIEFVNGTYSQPYLQLWPEWDQRKQFEIGQKTFDDIFGRHPTVYAAQEIAHHPALPGILNDYGFRYAVHRAQNLGNTPVDGSPLIDWRSPDGASIRTLPSHSLRSESYGSQFTRHLPFLLTDRKNNGLPFIAITSLMDQTFVDIYREEAARAHRYAPVWGEFVTPSEFFEKTRDLPAAGTSYTLDQYHYALDLDGNTIHGHQTGGYSSEHAFLFDESARLQRLEKNGKLPEDELRTHLNREGHDCYIIPYFAPGYFMEGLMTDYTGPRYRCVNDLPRGLDRTIRNAAGYPEAYTSSAPAIPEITDISKIVTVSPDTGAVTSINGNPCSLGLLNYNGAPLRAERVANGTVSGELPGFGNILINYFLSGGRLYCEVAALKIVKSWAADKICWRDCVCLEHALPAESEVIRTVCGVSQATKREKFHSLDKLELRIGGRPIRLYHGGNIFFRRTETAVQNRLWCYDEFCDRFWWAVDIEKINR